MRIAAVYERAVPMAAPMRNAVIDFGRMTTSVVAIECDVQQDGRPVIGYGFNSNGRYGASGLLRERFVPRLLRLNAESALDEAGVIDPVQVWAELLRDEKPGGHGERSVAVGVLDMALWDLAAKLHQVPLHHLLARRFGTGCPAESVSVYAAGGYYTPGHDLADLCDEIRAYLDMGYTDVKIKIGGAELDDDLRRVEAVLDLVEPASLAVDANGRFDLPRALEYANALEPYGLRWFEEPGDPLDFELLRRVAESYARPLATGENLFSHQDARNLVRYGGLRDGDLIQVDPVLSYGVSEYLRVIDVVEAGGLNRSCLVPHGGHQMALCLVAALGLGGNESYPRVFRPFGGFADDIPIDGGRVGLPDAPGIGLELRRELFDVLGGVVGERWRQDAAA